MWKLYEWDVVRHLWYGRKEGMAGAGPGVRGQMWGRWEITSISGIIFIPNGSSSFTSGFREILYMRLGFVTPHTCSTCYSLPVSSWQFAIKSSSKEDLWFLWENNKGGGFSSVSSQWWDLGWLTCQSLNSLVYKWVWSYLPLEVVLKCNEIHMWNT